MDEAGHLGPVTRKLKLRRETVRNLTEDILSSQAESLWTCPGSEKLGEPETTYVEIDAVRIDVHVEVHPTPRD